MIDYEKVKERLVRNGKCPRCLSAELDNQVTLENVGGGMMMPTNKAVCPACGWRDDD